MELPTRYPLACPACKSESGNPYAVSTIRGGGTAVNLRCEACRHEWHIENREPGLKDGSDDEGKTP